MEQDIAALESLKQKILKSGMTHEDLVELIDMVKHLRRLCVSDMCQTEVNPEAPE